MTLYQFKVLQLNEQAQATWKLGEHVATRMTATYKILLWVLEDFYLEIYYNYVKNKIEKIRSYKNPELLNPYLNQIDITNLLK